MQLQGQYPPELRFSFFALSPQITVLNNRGEEELFVHQKFLKLKEDVRIYRNATKNEELYRINADQIIDFSAQYHFTNSVTTQPLGSIARKGMKSIWRATYFCFDQSKQITHVVTETNPWAKIADGLLAQIPFVGILTIFFFHPSYTVFMGTDRNNTSKPVLRLTKKASVFEQRFEIEKLDQSLSEQEEERLLLGLLMLVQLERRRG